jgi:hypothetical protein
MKYLVEPAEPTPTDAIYHFDDIHDLTCADLACGSGHILNECFDLLYQIYIEEGYNRRKAIEDIFRYNLTGVDIDTRAKQLATFALLLKACQKDNSFIDAHVLPRVLTMPQTYDEEENGSITNFISQFFQGSETKQITSELVDAFNLMKDASSLGSIMKFTISESTRYVLAQTVDYWKQQSFVPKSIQNNMPGMELILSLTQKYSVLVMNPPYMKAANMNDILKEYVVKHYENGALDLYSVFMYFAMQNILKHGKISMIVQPTWLVNSSFGVMRNYILDNFGINSLLHMGRGNFGNDWGSIAFTLSEGEQNPNTMFFKLYERTFYRIETEHISSLFLAAKTKIEFRYPFSQYSSIHFSLGTGNEGQRICYMCPKNKFRRLKNSPFCYTFSDDIINIIKKTNISSSFSPATGLQTGNNTKFIRTWFETSNSDLRIKWFPLVNGGNFRKWYGNLTDIIYWNEDGKDIKNCKSSVLRNKQFYQKSGITWNRIASKGITIRAFPSGCLFDQAGDSMFCNDIDKLYTCMSYLNTKVAKIFFDMLAPTINLTAGMIGQLPYIDKESNCCLKITKENIDISKQDWDAHETSWDFQENELVRLKDEGFYSKVTIENEPIDIGITLCELCLHYKMQWEAKFNKLHVNEEELNREFIEIYGLQDELTPDVPLDEITILQQGEISIEDNQIVWHDDVLMKQLISYAVGCIMGRYSIDKPGLILANQGDGVNEYKEKVPNSRFEVDDDGIIPLMTSDTDFSDNATLRFKQWLTVAFGDEKLVENLNFIEGALGKSLDDYFVKDFWKDHKKMYQNRPIYWLFASKKGAFQCIAYMHRMNAYTAERIRTKYLLPHIEWLIHKQSEMEDQRSQPLHSPSVRRWTI